MTRKIFVSSANNSTGLDTIDGISFTNIVNSRGPSTEPWGTPLVTGMVEDLWPLSTDGLWHEMAQTLGQPQLSQG